MQNERSPVRSVIRAYFGFQFFFSLLVWLPVFYEFQKRIGLDDHQIFAIQSIYYIAFCVLEIPTGALADRWGTRNCLRLGALTLVAANLLPIYAQSYQGFLWHFLLIALSRSLISGASSAYLYDYLAHHQASGVFKEIEGKARAYGLIGKVACWAIVGWLMELRLTLPYWVTTASAVVSVGFAFTLPAEIRAREKRGFLDIFGFAGILRETPFLFFLTLQGVAIFTLGRIAQVNLFQPILSAKSMGVSTFGMVMSAMTLFEAVGSAYPSVIKRAMSDLTAVFVLTLAMALSLAAIPYSGAAMTVAWFCVFSLASGLAYPIQRQLMNDAIPDSRYRATLLSFESIVDRGVCAWSASLMGATVGSTAGLYGFIGSASAVTLGSVAILVLGLKARVGASRSGWGKA